MHTITYQSLIQYIIYAGMPISSSLRSACGVHLSSQATEVLKKQQINIRDARISTEEASPRATHVYIVEDRGGGGLSDQRLAEAWGSFLERASNTPIPAYLDFSFFWQVRAALQQLASGWVAVK